MIIDGLKEFVYSYQVRNEFDITQYQETFLRTQVKLVQNLLVIESDKTEYKLELVSNSGNVWKTLQEFEFTNKDDLFSKVGNLLESSRKSHGTEMFAKNTERVYNYIAENQNIHLPFEKIEKELGLGSTQLLHIIANLKKYRGLQLKKRYQLGKCSKGASRVVECHYIINEVKNDFLV